MLAAAPEFVAQFGGADAAGAADEADKAAKPDTGSHATVHSDDVDMINQVSKDGVTIAEAFNLKFGGDDDGIKMCDPSFMLGVQRKTRYDEKEDVYYHELTQSGCITDLYKEFESEMPKKTATTPMPEKTFLSMFTPEGDRREQSDEITAEIKGKGYMHIVGTLLWLSRNCYPEISQGLSQLCSVMSKPSQEAYDAALHMISYVMRCCAWCDDEDSDDEECTSTMYT